MNKKNQTLKDIYVEAINNYKKNNLKNTELLCYKILSIDPNHVDSIALLAAVFAMNKNFVKAKEFTLKGLEINPENISFLVNLGTTYRELGDFKEAINSYKKVLKKDPKHTNAHYNLGLVYHVLRELENAKKYLLRTVEIQKNYAMAFFSLANVHVDLKEYKQALSCYIRAIEQNPNIVSAHNNLGLLYRDLNDFENAISCYKKALSIKPDHANSHHNLALAYKELGEFEKSSKSHQMAIKSEPENLMNYHFLSEVKEEILDLSLKSKIEKILSKDNHNLVNLAYGNYLLAKYERKMKNYQKELNYLIKGHDSFFKCHEKKLSLNNKYCFDDVNQLSEGAHIEESEKKENYDVKPIFLIGVPRSGSTLVERIIGSGENIIPIGEETGVMGHFVRTKVMEKQSLNLGTFQEVRKELYDTYKEKGLISEKYDYKFTDKSLDNFFYINLIKEIYPKAKIINCKRDILSSIVSIFQNNLISLGWTHHLDNIFKYFNNYLKIIKSFNEKNPNVIYEVEYEKLVKDPEIESKKMMKFCELPWNKKCLEFYKRKDLFSKTASNIQIREAIYKGSINKYLPYKKLLDKYGNKYSWFNLKQ